MINIKPCAKCGGAGQLIENGCAFVYCTKCTHNAGVYDNPRDAIKAWNETHPDLKPRKPSEYEDDLLLFS